MGRQERCGTEQGELVSEPNLRASVDGILMIDNMRENKKRVEFLETNKSLQRLAAKIFIIAEAWAQSKGKTLEDIELVNPRLTNDDRIFFFDLKEKQNEEKQSLGIVDPSGQVVA